MLMGMKVLETCRDQTVHSRIGDSRDGSRNAAAGSSVKACPVSLEPSTRDVDRVHPLDPTWSEIGVLLESPDDREDSRGEPETSCGRSLLKVIKELVGGLHIHCEFSNVHFNLRAA